MTDTERQIARARTSLHGDSITPTTPVPVREEVPSYAADPGDHNVILNEFLAENRDWERYTWDDATTVATHKSLAVRIVFDHNAQSRQPKWTIVGYETPASDRTWHITAPSSTPAPVVNSLLKHLADGDVRAAPQAVPSPWRTSPTPPHPSRTPAGSTPTGTTRARPTGRTRPQTQGSAGTASAPTPRAVVLLSGGSGPVPVAPGPPG